MKLKFYTDSKDKKIYTLEENRNNEPTKSAHYKYIKLKSQSSTNH